MKLGRANVSIAENKEIIVFEPAAVLIDSDKKLFLGAGYESRMMTRYSGITEIIRPLQEIEKYPEFVEYMLDYFLQKALETQLFPFKPYVVAANPINLSRQDRAILVDVLSRLRVSKLHIVSELEAAAMGADLNDSLAILNIGYCGADIAVISDGSLYQPYSIAVGGQGFDNAIREYVKAQHNVLIGELTSELAKISLSNLSNGTPTQPEMNIQGRNLMNGMPQMITLTADEVSEVIDLTLFGLIKSLQDWRDCLPSEKQQALGQYGVVITGGTALLPGIDSFLSEHIGVPMRLADDPVGAAAIGASRIAQTTDWKRHKLG